MHSSRTKPGNYRGLILMVAFAFGGFFQASAQCTQADEPIALFNVQTLESNEIPTVDDGNHVGLELVESAFDDVRLHKYNEWTLVLPFLGGKTLPIELESFLPFSDAFMIGRSQAEGKFVEEIYRPKLLSYRVVSPGIKGTIVVMEDFVMGTIQYRGRQYDLSAIRNGAAGKHVLFLLADAARPLNFECGTYEMGDPRSAPKIENFPHSSSNPSSSECVEIAIDIDFYTFESFNSTCYQAVEWSLAILAGVNTIYMADLDSLINVQASYVHVWETPDPYANFTTTGVLTSLRDEWNVNPDLQAVERDIVHLMTKRNTSTGGVAYLDVLCLESFAFGFSSALTDELYPEIWNGYSWNLNVVTHELGHNFGANHTHWCGWSTGAIDSCWFAEPYNGDTCFLQNTPTVGTIMSYCHAVAGGSVNLEFHPTVIAEGFIPNITTDGSCIGSCVEMTSSCEYYGCTDAEACNYSIQAVEDDFSCEYVMDCCGVCGGDNSDCSGCMDSFACNYDSAAFIDDYSCVFPTDGFSCDCQSSMAFNVDSLEGGESVSEVVQGTGHITGITVILEFSAPQNLSWASELLLGIEAPNGSCLEIGGYNLSFGCADGGQWPNEWDTFLSGTYEATVVFPEPLNGNGEWIVSIMNSWDASTGASYDVEIVLDGLCGEMMEIEGCTNTQACNYNPLASVSNGDCDFTSCLGCTICHACNYNPVATIDDNSCDLSCGGCMDEEACNFDGEAINDDGSCEYDSCICYADLDGDHQVTIYDMLLFLSDYGCSAPPCFGDNTGDGLTNVDDLLLMLSNFGNICE